MVTKLGLAQQIDDALKLLKVHLPYHESDHVLNLAYNVLCGGTRLEDIERLRHSTAYMNALGAALIPDPTTAGDFCRRFAADDVVALMEAINAVRPQLWRGRARELLGPVRRRYTGTDVRGEESGHGHLLQGSGGVRAADRLRGQHEGSAVRGQPPGQRRLERKPRYETLTDGTRQRFQENEKERIVRERAYLNLKLNHEDVAEFQYQPGKCQRPYRVVVVRKNISKTKGEAVLFDQIRYLFYITTRTDLTAAAVVRCANARCDQENVIEQLKNGVNALRVPLYDLVSNGAYMVMAALAWNLKSWFALMMHRKRDRVEYIAMEFRRFLHSMILIPCRVMRRARGITLRLLGYQPTLDRFFSTWLAIERTGFA